MAKRNESLTEQLIKIINYLIEPSPAITDIGKRRNSRLLSTLLLSLFLLFLGLMISYSLTVPDYIPPLTDLIGYMVLLGTYIISRTRFTKIAIVILPRWR